VHSALLPDRDVHRRHAPLARGWDPVYDWEYIVLVAGMVTAPIGFLLGIGVFDYWLYWISGPARRWSTTTRTTAPTVEGLLQGQHRPQGDRDPVPRHDVLLLRRRRLPRDARSAPSSRSPGCSSSTRRPFNGLVSAHATLMIFVFIIPAFAGLANFACR
jgi:cytochrome c oxidase subunit 1